MAKLSERIKDAIAHEMNPDRLVDLLELSRPVCDAVELFQAAEQALEAAPPYNSRGVNDEREAAYKQYDAAKARLLEVNLD